MTQPKPFGQVAVELGFVNESQVQAALEIQRSMQKTRKERRLLGMIMLETGMISTEQLIDVLKYYETREGTPRPGAADQAPVEDDSAG